MRRIWVDTYSSPRPGKRHISNPQEESRPLTKYKYKNFKPKYRKKREPSFYPATSNARERLLLNLHGQKQVEMVISPQLPDVHLVPVLDV